jgi:RND family efflux transporter MFP subunit
MNKPTDRQDIWSALPFETVLERFESSSGGLSEDEAARRLAQSGPNRLPSAKRRIPLLRFLLQFHNVLIYVLLAASVVTAFLGHWVDTGVIVAVVVINAIIGFIQEGKAEQAMDAVRKMLSLQATVVRDGHRLVVDAEAVVPGDIVFVQSGDKVPADMRLIRVKSLQIQEAALTGESLPVDKDVPAVAQDALLGDQTSMAYSGTVVTYGQGTGVVVATGTATEIGRISAMLSEVEELTTPLLRRMAEFARWLTVVILALALAVFLVGTLVWSFSPSEMFMAAVGLAVSAIPEGLPAIITITLAIGVERMARRNAIIRRLPAVETLGAVTTICSDKTGTLTRNELMVRTVVTADAAYETSGSGYDPHGGFIKDGTDMPVDGAPDLAETLRAAALCNDAVLHEKDGVWTVDGDPTEGALLTAAVKGGIDLRIQSRELPRTDEIPFESQHRFMATLHHDHDGKGFIFVKGAPERLLEMCFWQRDGGEEHSLDCDHWLARIDEIAAKGQRVLGVAAKRTVAKHCELTFGDVESGLVFLGLIGLIDPPREEAVDAVRECAEAGISVKMITGDHAATAVAIGRELGLVNPDAVVTGRDLDALSDEELSRTVLNTTIFARTSPEHKLRLVKSLQSHDQIVAMTGDGVNDAPALKRADIGIAMGVKGTEAAKEAAEMVLADDNFASIVHAVHEGRVVYENLKKTILFILPTNGGEAMTVVSAIALGEVLPVTPVQILWINLITAVTLGMALAFEPPSPGVMARPPRAPTEPILSGYFVWRIIFVSFLMLIATFGLYELEKAEGMGLDSARTVAVNTLVACEVTYLFNARFLSEPSLSWRGFFGSRAALIAVGLVVIFQALFTYAPWMQTLFGTVALDFETWVHIIAVSIALYFVVEIEKAVFRSPWAPRIFSLLLPLRANRRRWARPLQAALLVLLVLGGGWAYRSMYLGGEHVVTQEATRDPTTRVVRGDGVVNPVTVAPVGAQAMGVVQSILCDRGTKVAKGQLCAKLDPNSFQGAVDRERSALAAADAQVAESKANLASAQADFNRKMTLRKRGAITRKAFDASRRTVTQAQARVGRAEATATERRAMLAAAEAALGKTEVLASSDGIVVARNIEPGQTVATGVDTPLFLVATDLAYMRVAIKTSEKDASAIKIGDKAIITVTTLPGQSFSGVVSSVRQAAEPSEKGAAFDVEIDAPNPDLLLEPGMAATASIEVDKRDDLLRAPN